MRSRFATCSAVAALVLSTSGLPGQDGAPRALGRPTHTPGAEFSVVSWVVELRPGQLLVGDAENQQIATLDLATGTSRPVARTGAGPREYRTVGEYVLPRREGGAFVVDFAQRRLLPVLQDGSVGEVIGYPARLLLHHGDGSGRLYGEIMRYSAARELSDSISVVRWDPNSDRLDTLVTFDAGRSAMVSSGGPMRVWPPTASWLVQADGRIVVVGSAPYQVRSWTSARWSAPVALPWPNRAPTNAEIAAKRAELEAQPIRGMGTGGGAAPKRPEWAFPPKLPAFEGFSDTPVRAAPDGTFWIPRLDPSNSAQHYDIVDLTRVRGRVTLPKGSAVVGFGAGGLYVSEVDRDDIVRIRRYAMPTWP